jgi:hypothetical protein
MIELILKEILRVKVIFTSQGIVIIVITCLPMNSPRFPVDKKLNEMLMQTGIDSALAYHFASLFIRDPLVVFEKAVEMDSMKNMTHFENFQLTN